jgi:SH3 domain containing protein
VPLRKISFLDDKVVKAWKNARHIELIDEFYPITDVEGNFVFKSRVGMRLPIVSIEKDYYLALAITAGKNHSATYTKVKVPFHVGREGKMMLNTDNLKHCRPDAAKQLRLGRDIPGERLFIDIARSLCSFWNMASEKFIRAIQGRQSHHTQRDDPGRKRGGHHTRGYTF